MFPKLIEMTEYQTPDGITYRFQNHERFVIAEGGFGLPPIEYMQSVDTYQHGATYYDYRLQPRVIQLMVRTVGCSREDYWVNRANILNILRPNRSLAGTFGLGRLVKRFMDGSARAIDVIIENGPVFEKAENKWDEYSFTEAIRFVAPDPTFYNPTQVVASWFIPTETASIIFPFYGPTAISTSFISPSLTITYPGTWDSYPIIVLSGPMATPVITNAATGDVIRLNYTIADTEIITIDLTQGHKTITSNMFGNIIGTLSTDSNISTFKIACDPEASGGINVITIYAGRTNELKTCATIAYYVRYIGI